MAFSTPRTWTAGELVTDTILNAHIKDQFDFLSTHAHSGATGDGSSALADLDTIIWDHQGSDPSAPAGGHGTVYLKSDGLYLRQTGGSASRLALASELHAESHNHAVGVGQVVEATGTLGQNYGDGDTDEETVATATITAGASNRSYIITAGIVVRSSTASTVNATLKLYYDTTVLETVNDTDFQVGDLHVLSQTQSNPATSSKVVKLTCQIASGGSHISGATISVREVYATDD